MLKGTLHEVADVDHLDVIALSPPPRPVISWPRTRPFGAVVRPLTMCWSEPQMFVVTIFRMTPCGASGPPNGIGLTGLGIFNFG